MIDQDKMRALAQRVLDTLEKPDNEAFEAARYQFRAATHPETILALLDELEAAARERDTLRVALQLLHDETADYVRVNNLGDPHQNQSMRMARDALAQRQGEGS